MPSNDLSLFWEEAIRQLRESEGEISEEEFAIWFKGMFLKSCSDDTIILSVPSNFYKQQMENRFLKSIRKKLFDLSGIEITITFDISSPQPTPRKYPQEESERRDDDETPPTKRPENLRAEYTFENFVIGNNNSFAASASMAIAKNPGSKYNPCLIYGGVGLGKTHLLQSIGNETFRNFRKKRVVYVTAETFVTEFIQSIKNESQSLFKSKYRNVDVLLIDDIHDLRNKKETQEELFFTFNSLYDTNKQMVFTCDRPTSELKNFTDRLKSRFERGLNVDLQPPSYETIYAILKKKLEKKDVAISEEILEIISRNITTNVRDVEAALMKLIAYSDLVGKEITIDVARDQLKSIFSGPAPVKVSIDRVQRIISDYFGLSVGDLKGKKRTKNIAFSRQIAMYIIREVTDYSTTEIGLEFGGRDHTTVMHSYQRIEDMMKTDPSMKPLIQNLTRSVKEHGDKL